MMPKFLVRVSDFCNRKSTNIINISNTKLDKRFRHDRIYYERIVLLILNQRIKENS